MVRLAEAEPGATDCRPDRLVDQLLPSIVDVYLPRRAEVALTAIELWEKAPQVDSKVMKLGLAKRR